MVFNKSRKQIYLTYRYAIACFKENTDASEGKQLEINNRTGTGNEQGRETENTFTINSADICGGCEALYSTLDNTL